MILIRENVEVIENNHERIKALIDKGFYPVDDMTDADEEELIYADPEVFEKDEPENAEKDNSEEEETFEETKPSELSDLKKEDLVRMASDIGITGARNLTKPELIEVLCASAEAPKTEETEEQEV